MTDHGDGSGYRFEKYDFSLTSIGRGFLLILLPLAALTAGALPTIFSLVYVVRLLDFGSLVHVMAFTFVLVLEALLLVVMETFVPGLFIRAMRLHVAEGEHQVSIKDGQFFRYLLFFVLYRPALRMVSLLPLVPLRTRLLRLVGLTMGQSSVLAGSELIHDPYMVEIGEHTLIGGHVWILGHVTKETLRVKPVRIGDNCLIGAKAVIMPGATIKDNVTVGLQALVLEDQVLEAGKTYVGIPARPVNAGGGERNN